MLRLPLVTFPTGVYNKNDLEFPMLKEDNNMFLKKLNALLGELSILFMLLHIGYNVYAYLSFTYNPLMKNLTAYPFLVLVCLHAVCGMLTLFLNPDGGRADLYVKQNLGTILQRVSAVLILPLLILHMNTFALMSAAAEGGQSFFVLLLMLGEILFFACVITHISLSLTKGLVTLGVLSSEKTKKAIDRFLYALFFIVFVVSCAVVLKGQVQMFFPG